MKSRQMYNHLRGPLYKYHLVRFTSLDPSGSENLILGLQHPGEQVMFLQMGRSVIQV